MYAGIVAFLLALLSAAAYGAADFLGGLASKRAATLAVVVITQASGLLVLVVLFPVLPPSAPARADMWWGLAAGVTGSVGVALLYRALAIGTMAIVAPTTAVCAVIIPVVAAWLWGERPGTRALVGVLIALVAIVLVSQASEDSIPDSKPQTPNHEHARFWNLELGVWSSPWRRRGGGTARLVPRSLGLALASGVAIGFFFLCLAETRPQAGLWPLAAARAASLALFTPVALQRHRFRLSRRVFVTALGGGILDMLANALYLIAVREGPVTIVVTLSSLYPASTVLLARVVLHERLRVVQVAGIALALAAVVLIVS